MNIVMIGTGYVGLVTGTCFSEVGHNVICVDSNKEKIKKLHEGISPIYEPGLEDLISRNRSHDRLHFTTNLEEALQSAEMAFIAVGTPEGEDGSADLSYVKAVAHSIGKSLKSDLIVVVKSTVPVGTCDIVEQIIEEQLKSRGAKHEVVVASNPEFLKEGNAIQDFMRPDRIVVGLEDQHATHSFLELYKPFILDDQGKLVFMDRRSSEITKYGANAMLATRISFMNELAILCEQIGADIDNVRRGIGADVRIGRKFLYAGPGYGGSCFPKDVLALLRTSQTVGVDLKVLNAVTVANDNQKLHVFQKIKNYFGDLNGKKIALWGLTFKPGTDDVREAPAKTVIEKLIAEGAHIAAHDPIGRHTFAGEYGDHSRLVYKESAYDALEGAEALVLMTEWSEYRRPNWEKAAKMMKNQVVFDFRNQYDPQEILNLGFTYFCVGRLESGSRREKILAAKNHRQGSSHKSTSSTPRRNLEPSI